MFGMHNPRKSEVMKKHQNMTAQKTAGEEARGKELNEMKPNLMFQAVAPGQQPSPS